MNIQRLVIGLVVLALVLFSACSNTSAQPSPTPQPPLSPAQTNTEIAPAAAATEPPTQVLPAQQNATATIAPTKAAVAAATAVPTLSTSGSSNSVGVPIGNITEVLAKACTAFKAQPNIISHLVFTGTDAGEIMVEVAGNDRAHFALSSTKNSKVSTQEMTVIVPKFYINDEGTWVAQPLPTASAVKATTAQVTAARSLAGLLICLSDKTMSQIRAQVTDVRSKLALPEIVDGVPTLVYDVNVTVVNGKNPGTGEIKYWLGATDSVPHKLSLDFTSAKQSGHADGTYSYSVPDIQAPIP